MTTAKNKCLAAGERWALVRETREGSKLVADDGFTCLKDGAVRTVSRDKNGELFIRCAEGRHYLYGQFETHKRGNYYVGLTKLEESE